MPEGGATKKGEVSELTVYHSASKQGVERTIKSS